MEEINKSLLFTLTDGDAPMTYKDGILFAESEEATRSSSE